MERTHEIIAKSIDGRMAIGIDRENKEEIINYLNQSDRHIKKFRHIVELLLNGHKNTQLYDKEDFNKKAKNITAMKFFKGQENDRIYCVEANLNDMRVIIMIEIYYRKKSQSITKREIQVLNKIAKYEYQNE